MEDGRVVEQGRPAELMTCAGSRTQDFCAKISELYGDNF
jgi:ABC-type multidrug transport system fused ATPase/permease subunit